MSLPVHKYLKSLTLAGWIALSQVPDWVFAQGYETQKQVWNILSGVCLPELSDLSALRETYTIQSWDTFSGIASKMWINYWDFILYLKEFNHWLDPNTTIHIWDKFYILSQSVSQKQIDENTIAIKQKQYVQEIKRIAESGDFETLKGYLSFDITPSLPVNLWVGRAYQTSANMYSQWLRISSRSALPELENQAVCKHILSQSLARFIGYNTPWKPNEIREIMLREHVPAWILPHILETEWSYERKEDMDLRSYFNKNFSRNRIAIWKDNQVQYSEGLKRQLSYLRTPKAVWCFIPTLFHGTNYSETALSESKWRDMNSHIFACNWFSYSETFPVEKYWFLKWISWNFTPVLVEMIRDLWVISRYQSTSEKNIISWLREIYEFIIVEVQKSDDSWTKLVLDSNLQITNISEIDINNIIWFRTGWNILTDGFQISPYNGKKLIEQRLTPDWVVYASHYFNVFHPTSILTAPQDLLYSESNDTISRYVSQIDILRFFDITREELAVGKSIKGEYFEQIAQEVYKKGFWELSDEEKSHIEKIYQTHSLGLQILWYHSFNGIDWNPGATNINAAIPFLNIFSEQEIQSIQSLYKKYISEKKQEYIWKITSTCTEGKTMPFPIMYFKFFPWDTTSSLWNILSLYVSQHNKTLSLSMNKMLQTQRDPLIKLIFWDQIWAWNIRAWWEVFLVTKDILTLLSDAVWKNQIGQDYVSQLSSSDKDLLEALGNNIQLNQALAYYLIKEWYVPDTWYQLDDKSLDDIAENFISRLKRKDQKRYYAWLSENNFLKLNQELIKYVESKINDENPSIKDKALVKIKDYLSKIPKNGPNSWGDLQMRFSNLLDSEYAFKRWPTNTDLESAIEIITKPNEKLSEILETYKWMYSEEYNHDREIITEIKNELSQKTPDGKHIYKLLIEIIRLNDTTDRHLIGKILSLTLSQSLHRENIWHICEQLSKVWRLCNNLNNKKLESLYAYSMLIMNKWPNVALSLVTENYLLRIFELFRDIYPQVGTPKIKIQQEVWITPKPILNYFELRKRMEQYIDFYTPYVRDNSDIKILVDILTEFLKSDEEVSQKHFRVLSNNNLQEILWKHQKDTFIYPNNSERNIDNHTVQKDDITKARTTFFAYINDKNIEWFIVEPEQKNTDFIAPYMLIMFYWQALSVILIGLLWKSIEVTWNWVFQSIKHFINIWKGLSIFWYRKLQENIKKQRENHRKRKNNTIMKRFYNVLQDNITETKINILDAYTDEQVRQRNGENIVFGNINNASHTNYADGFYKIWGTQENPSILKLQSFVLTNIGWIMSEIPYKDWEYYKISPPSTPLERVMRELNTVHEIPKATFKIAAE